MTNYDAHYPPGANADLLRIEREQEETARRLADIERIVRDDPSELLGYLDENEQATRLRRMLKLCRDYRVGHYRCLDTFAGKIIHEWEAAIAEAMEQARKQEGIL